MPRRPWESHRRAQATGHRQRRELQAPEPPLCHTQAPMTRRHRPHPESEEEPKRAPAQEEGSTNGRRDARKSPRRAPATVRRSAGLYSQMSGVQRVLATRAQRVANGMDGASKLGKRPGVGIFGVRLSLPMSLFSFASGPPWPRSKGGIAFVKGCVGNYVSSVSCRRCAIPHLPHDATRTRYHDRDTVPQP